MNNPDAESAERPRRILAGFGSLADEAATIDTALALARALQAEVAGHFVEESNLLDLAGLPFARAVRAAGRSVTPIESSHMKREIAHAASTWRRALTAKAERSSITYSFHTCTGEYCSEIAKVTAETDVVVVNPANVSRLGHTGARTVLDSFAAYAGLVVLPERRNTGNGPVALLMDAETGASALALARRVAEVSETELIVVALPGIDDDETELRRRIVEAIGTNARIIFPILPASDEWIASVAALTPSYIVWPGWNLAEDKDLAERLLRTAGAPLVLLRHVR